MHNLKILATSSHNIIQRHSSHAHVKKKYRPKPVTPSPRVDIPSPYQPPMVDVTSTYKAPRVDITSPYQDLRVHIPSTHLDPKVEIPRPQQTLRTAIDTPAPIDMRTRSRTKLIPPIPTEATSHYGPARRTISQSNKQLDTELSIACLVTTQPDLTRQLAGRKFP